MKNVPACLTFAFLFLCHSLFACLSAQAGNCLIITHDMQYQYAESLFAKKDYETALVEYKRLIHFFPDSPHLQTSEFNAARCLFFLKRYPEAAKAFDRIIQKDEHGKFSARSVLYQARAFLAADNAGYAQITLQNYLKITEDTDAKDDMRFMLTGIKMELAGQGDFAALQAAAQHLDQISPEGKKRLNTFVIREQIHTAQQAEMKSPALSGALSVIPGGGFAYCGRYKDALVTFLLNAGLITAAWQAWDNDNEALAGVIGFVESGFYTANIYGGVSSAHKHNRNQVRKILDFDWTLQPEIDPESNGLGLSLNIPF